MGLSYTRSNASQSSGQMLGSLWHEVCHMMLSALNMHEYISFMITKESELHHSIGSPIDGAHPGPKTDRDYLGRYCP